MTPRDRPGGDDVAFDSADASWSRRALLKTGSAFAVGGALAESSFAAAGAGWETNWIMEFRQMSEPVMELRQYKIFAGKREQMIAVFDGKLVEPQEDSGMRVLGQFRDLDDPNRFTWMREFPSMQARGRALTDFYTGPAWQAHRGEANPLLEDNDNVLLLRPAVPELALSSPASARPRLGSQPSSAGLIVATIHYLWKAPAEGFAKFFQERLKPELEQAGMPVLGAYVTEPTPNNFPALPVRQHEKVFVWFTRASGAPAFEKARTNVNASVGAELADFQERPAQVLRLSPTSRSLLR